MTLPLTLDELVADLHRRIAELERRVANARRTGVVAEADFATGRYRVRLSEGGGAGFLTPWIPAREIAAGAIRAWAPLAIGEQVTLSSGSGDLTDAVIEGSLPSQTFPRPHDQGAELVIVIGETRLTLTAGEARVDSPVIRLVGATEARVESPKIVLAGETHLGGEGGKPVHRRDDADSAGDVAVGSASKVYAL